MEEKEKAQVDLGEKSSEKEQELAKTQEEKVEVKPTYKVFGQDFSLSDPDIIDYYKTRMKMMAIKYKLVGRVNDKAQYVVPDAIRHDLIKMEKEIEESGEDFYKAIALYMKKHFYFHIKIIPIEDGKAKASLFLSEWVEDFLGMQYVVSHVADFVDVFDDEFRIKLRKAFNLVDVATKVDDFAVPDLAVLMQDCFDLELVVGGLYDMASQIFLMRLLKALEESGESGAKVLAKYRELLANSKDIEIDEKFRNTHYKALLDRAIDELGGYEKLGMDPKVLNSIVKDINGTVKAIDNASGRGGYIEGEGAVKPKIEEQKGKKGGSSTKKGGGGGQNSTPKKPKKEEKKKPAVKEQPATVKKSGVTKEDLDKIFAEKAQTPQKPAPQGSTASKPKESGSEPAPIIPETEQPTIEEESDAFAVDEFAYEEESASAAEASIRVTEASVKVTQTVTFMPDGTKITTTEEEVEFVARVVEDDGPEIE